MQKEVIPLFNIFSNRLDDFVDSSDNKDLISGRQSKNTTSPQLPATKRNRDTGYSKMEERAIKKNRVAGHSEIKEGIGGTNKVASHSEIEKRDVKKNRVAGHSRIKRKIEESANGDLSDISFSIKK